MTVETVVPLVVLLLAVGAVALVVWARAQRRRALRSWAQARGWRYRDRDRELVRTLRGGPFGTGSGRHAAEILEGTFVGRPARSFRYTYRVRSPGVHGQPTTTTYHVHVVALSLPALLPTIELTPETGLTRVATFFGARDVDFEHEGFNRAWRVQGPSEQVTFDVVHPRMMERLMRADLRGENLLIENGTIMWWRRGTPDVAAIRPALEGLTEVVDLVPSFVWDNFGR